MKDLLTCIIQQNTQIMHPQKPRIVAGRPTIRKKAIKAELKDEKTTWQEYLKFVPVAYAYLVLLGFIRLYVYYMLFNININDYLELTEILVTFMDDILFYLMYFIIAAILSIIVNRMLKKLTQKDRALKGKNLEERYRVIIKRINLFVVICIALFSVVSVNEYLNNHIELAISSFILFSSVFIGVRLVFLKPIPSSRKQINRRMILLVLSIMFVIISHTSVEDYTNVKYESNFTISEIEYGGEIIKSDSVRFVIGKSNNYVFYHNIIDKTSTALPVSNVGYIKNIKADVIYLR